MSTILIATMFFGMAAKFLEFKLEKHMSKDNFVDVEQLKEQSYSLKNVETF